MTDPSRVLSIPPMSGCTGCFGCANACPTSSISMTLTQEGFYRAHVDSENCAGCGFCIRHCPVASPSTSSNRWGDTVRAFAAWTANEEIRVASSSGGIFSALALMVLQDGGRVCGAAWCDDWSVSHQVVDRVERLHLLRGSKYLPSRVGDAYRQVMQALRETEGPVIFSGLPCQVAALRKFTEHPRILSVELACYGVPSLAVFRKYLHSVTAGRRVIGINFRDKRLGWQRFGMTVTFDDGSEHTQTFRENPFMAGFLGNLYCNEICSDCPFCAMPRQGDITLADYWGVATALRSDSGVSLILSNNCKGDEWLDRLRMQHATEIHKTPFEECLRGNPRLVDGSRPIPSSRPAFFRDLQDADFSALNVRYIRPLAVFDKP